MEAAFQIHDVGVRHTQLDKSANILLDKNGKPRIIDFAKAELEKCTRQHKILQWGTAMPNTAKFDCPELLGLMDELGGWKPSKSTVRDRIIVD